MSATTAEKLISTDNVINVLITERNWKPEFISALLNSTFIAWLYTNQSTIAVKDDFPQVTLAEVGALPIPFITFTTATDRRNQLAEKGHKLYERCLGEGHACVLEF